MTVFAPRILKSASRDLERLDKPIARRIVQRIRWLSENVETIKPEALKGDLAGLFKLREGDYRILGANTVTPASGDLQCRPW